ncbi:MAG: energy transducer TonB [Bacteriovoracaceae bacterium]|nr:energy transducer TonB [Bacteriovoracaceae bacterium]
MVLQKQSHLYLTSLLLGGPVTFVLFLLMAHLVSQPAELGKSSDTENYIDFIRSVNTSQVQTKKRQLPKEPEKPQETPQMPKMAVKAQVDAPAPKMAMNAPLLTSSLSLGDGPYLGGATGGGTAQTDRSVMPLVRIEPQYPRKAAMTGKQGWVRLQFDVNAAGGVENVEVVEASPPRIFDQSAKRALLKWKYQPKIVDGKPVIMKGLKVQLDFKLTR